MYMYAIYSYKLICSHVRYERRLWLTFPCTTKTHAVMPLLAITFQILLLRFFLRKKRVVIIKISTIMNRYLMFIKVMLLRQTIETRFFCVFLTDYAWTRSFNTKWDSVKKKNQGTSPVNIWDTSSLFVISLFHIFSIFNIVTRKRSAVG